MANINEIEIDGVVHDIESKKLSNSRKISIKGGAEGSASFDGSKDISIEVKVGTDHGNHVPTTESANNTRFLRNDNTWQEVTPDNIGALSSKDFTVSNGVLTFNFL